MKMIDYSPIIDSLTKKIKSLHDSCSDSTSSEMYRLIAVLNDILSKIKNEEYDELKSLQIDKGFNINLIDNVIFIYDQKQAVPKAKSENGTFVLFLTEGIEYITLFNEGIGIFFPYYEN